MNHYRLGVEELTVYPLLANSPLQTLARQLGATGGAEGSAVGHILRSCEQAAGRVLLAVDDAHRAADGVWRTLFGLVREVWRSRSAPVAVVAVEPAMIPEHTLRRLGRAVAAGEARRIDLGPLDGHGVHEMLGSLFGEGAIPAGVREEIARRAGGSPLLAEEIVREMVETGQLAAGAGGWRMAAGGGGQAPSARLQDYLRRRCRDVSADAKSSLLALAALGGSAPAPALGAFLGSSADVAVGIADLRERGLVLAEGEEVALASDTLAEVVLEDEPEESRRRRQEQAARFLSSRGANDGALARAFLGAGDLHAACAHALAAGLEAVAAGEGRVAAHWLEEARKLADRTCAGAEQRSRLLAGLAEAHDLQSRWEDAIAAWEQALAVMGGAPARERVRLATQAARAAAKIPDLGRAERWIERARENADGDDAFSGAMIDWAAGVVALNAGRCDLARSRLRSALGKLPSAEISGETEALRAKVLLALGSAECRFDVHAARAAWLEGLQAARATGSRHLLGGALLDLGAAEWALGLADASAARFREAYELFDVAGDADMLSAAMGNLAYAELLRGKWDESRILAEDARAAAAAEDREVERSGEEAILAWWRGETEKVGEAARHAATLAGAMEHRALYGLVAAAAAAEHGGEIPRLLPPDTGEETPATFDAACGQAAAGYAALARGEAGGVRMLADAATALDRSGWRSLLPPLLRDAARWAARLGDPDLARRHLEHARARLAEIGCSPAVVALDAAGERLREGLVPGPAQPRAGWLSPLFAARSLPDLGRAVAAVAPALAVAGPVHLLVEHGGSIGHAVPERDHEIDDATRKAAAAALAAGESLRRGAVAYHPSTPGLRACLAVAGASDPAAEHLLAEVVRVAAFLLRGRAQPAEREAKDDERSPPAPPWAPSPERAWSLDLTLGQLEVRHPGLVGHSAAFSRAVRLVDQLAATDIPVLLTGETGTGKELFARALHHASRRAGGFVAVNCAAIPVELFEDELFGHRHGAFSGAREDRAGLLEQAHGGTLFLDEVGELPAVVQPKLLRVLEDRRIRRLGSGDEVSTDFRLLAATKKDLDGEARAGHFRADLYYRINGAEIGLPPLRERTADLPALCRHLLDRHHLGGQVISGPALDLVLRHRWPGNIRELENELLRAAVLAQGSPIQPQHLSPRVARADAPPKAPSIGALAERVEAFRRETMAAALREEGQNQVRAARRLGMTRQGLQAAIEAAGPWQPLNCGRRRRAKGAARRHVGRRAPHFMPNRLGSPGGSTGVSSGKPA